MKSIPFYSDLASLYRASHSTIQRECLDQTLFWNDVDLQNKLDYFTHYYNNHRVHSSFMSEVPVRFGEERIEPVASLGKFNWKTL